MNKDNFNKFSISTYYKIKMYDSTLKSELNLN